MRALSRFKKSQYVLASSSLALIGCTSSSTVQPVRAAGPSGVQNILFVHGAWADGSSWNQVISILSADGYNVTAVQLPLTSLADERMVRHCWWPTRTGVSS
jgi:pimeloyl-ACP methyl ester carboxylesterase